MEDLVLVDKREDGVTILTLNRPSARNAFNLDLAKALVEAVNANQDARCLVITGADPAFSAGLDLRDLGTDSLNDLPNFIKCVADSQVPVIAAVNGPAVTGGFEVALACDFIVASDRARFADTHVRVGVYPGPVLVDLPRRVGMAKAREMSMTGNFVDAIEAHRIGLANHLVPHGDLMGFTLGLAGAIAEQDPAMLQVMRRDWNETGTMPYHDAHRRHGEIAREAAVGSRTRDTLQKNMSAVVSRAKNQPGARH